MRYYCADPERSKRCQAIGVTASPGAKVTVEETEEVVRELQASFGPTARLFAIGGRCVSCGMEVTAKPFKLPVR